MILWPLDLSGRVDPNLQHNFQKYYYIISQISVIWIVTWHQNRWDSSLRSPTVSSSGCPLVLHFRIYPQTIIHEVPRSFNYYSGVCLVSNTNFQFVLMLDRWVLLESLRSNHSMILCFPRMKERIFNFQIRSCTPKNLESLDQIPQTRNLTFISPVVYRSTSWSKLPDQ